MQSQCVRMSYCFSISIVHIKVMINGRLRAIHIDEKTRPHENKKTTSHTICLVYYCVNWIKKIVNSCVSINIVAIIFGRVNILHKSVFLLILYNLGETFITYLSLALQFWNSPFDRIIWKNHTHTKNVIAANLSLVHIFVYIFPSLHFPLSNIYHCIKNIVFLFSLHIISSIYIEKVTNKKYRISWIQLKIW